MRTDYRRLTTSIYVSATVVSRASPDGTPVTPQNGPDKPTFLLALAALGSTRPRQPRRDNDVFGAHLMNIMGNLAVDTAMNDPQKTLLLMLIIHLSTTCMIMALAAILTYSSHLWGLGAP